MMMATVGLIWQIMLNRSNITEWKQLSLLLWGLYTFTLYSTFATIPLS